MKTLHDNNFPRLFLKLSPHIFFIFLFVFSSSFITLPSGIHAAETIRLASGEWAPYQSKNLKHAGFVSRIITEAFAHSDIKTELSYFPWKRSYKLAEMGTWDGTFIWFATPERKQFFYISDPVITIQYVFFYNKNRSFNWKTVNNLIGVTIGGTKGYNYGNAFQTAEKEKRIKVFRVPDDKKNFELLRKGRIQIFPCELETGYEIIRKNFSPEIANQFTHHPLPVKTAPHHLLLSKKKQANKKMIELFNIGLKHLKENGSIDKYIEESGLGKYILLNDFIN